MEGTILYKWKWFIFNVGDVPFYANVFNDENEGEDTPDAKVDHSSTSEKKLYRESCQYFGNVESCVEEGLKYKPLLLSWMSQYSSSVMLVEPHSLTCSSPSYSDEKKRLETFKDWPMYFHPTSEELAKAGLYYLGTSDRVKCFCCGIILKNWKVDDSPWMEHKKHACNCPFVNTFLSDK